MAASHVTDLVQLDFANVVHAGLENAVFAWGHALKLAGAELLEIDHREIGVVFGPIGASAKTGIQLFDNTAGGAGHVLELAAAGEAWLTRALAVMHRDPEHHARCENACLLCLLTAASQSDFETGRLHRRNAHRTLEELLSGIAHGRDPEPSLSLPSVSSPKARAEVFRQKSDRVPAAIAKLLSEADLRAHDAIMACARNRWPIPDGGFEPIGPDGAIIGIVELAWPKKLIACITHEQGDQRKEMEACGWTILLLPVSEAELGKFLRE
jgi:hypothetical protein